MTKVPDLLPLDSSVLGGMHYDPPTSRLTLEFKSGAVHQYEDVPMEKAEALRENASPGRFFGEKIRGRYAGRQIR